MSLLFRENYSLNFEGRDWLVVCGDWSVCPSIHAVDQNFQPFYKEWVSSSESSLMCGSWNVKACYSLQSRVVLSSPLLLSLSFYSFIPSLLPWHSPMRAHEGLHPSSVYFLLS